MPSRDLKANQLRGNRAAILSEMRIERELLRNYADAVEAIRRDLSRLYERYGENGVLTHAEMSKYSRLRSLEKQLTEDLRPVVLRNRALIERLTEVQYEESFYRHAWAIEQTVGVGLRWGTVSAEQVRAAVANDLRHLAQRGVAQQTLVRVQRSVSQGIIRGQTLRQMMLGVRAAMENTASEAMRIARTEAHRARELGSKLASETASEQGITRRRVWDATLDTRTRNRHAALDGRPESEWRLGGIRPEFPGDPRLAARDSINCRCTAVDEITGYSPRLRRVRGEGLQPYQTFGDWAKGRGIRASRYGEEYNFLGAA